MVAPTSVMPEPPPGAGVAPARPVDAIALARHASRVRASAEPPWLHAEVARRMAERLPVIRSEPETVLDWWAPARVGATLLASAYPRARRIAVQPGPVAGPAATAPWWSPRRWAGAASPSCAEDAVAPASAQLVWANMMLHAVPDPPAVFARWHRALAVDGFLMFSTLGPGTLEGLSALFARAGWGPALAPFVDMHDLGDQLVQAGFADPVMDQETLTLTWPDAAAALAELRTLGGNAAPGRFTGLRTPRWRQRLLQALASTAGPDGRPRLSFEIVYGHAFRPPPRARLGGETTVSVDELRQMVRSGRRPAG